MRHHRSLLALALCALAACDSPMPLGLQPDDINGTWVEVRPPGEPPGFALSIALSAHDETITGTGTWQGEAHPGGTVSATGSIYIASVTLDLTFTTVVNGVAQSGTSTEHFVGGLTSDNNLEGTKTVNGLSSAMHLRRVVP